MKKNRTMKAAAVLLALTLMTSCFVGGTFAKYVTSDSASDTARVAEWGVEVLASGNLFGKGYAKNDGSANSDKITVATSNSVSADAKVVAPGTKNTEGLTVQITGDPEVSYQTTVTSADAKDIYLGTGHWGVMVKATGLNDASDVTGYYTSADAENFNKVTTPTWDSGEIYYELHDHVVVDTEPYYPLTWGVKVNGGIINEQKNLAAIAGDMQTAFEDKDGTAQDNPALKYVLTWEWKFDNGNDKADTMLGNLFDGNADGIEVYNSTNADSFAKVTALDPYCLDVSLNFALTVEQTN